MGGGSDQVKYKTIGRLKIDKNTINYVRWAITHTYDVIHDQLAAVLHMNTSMAR